MIKTIATPVSAGRCLDPDAAAEYGHQSMSPEEEDARAADTAALQVEVDARAVVTARLRAYPSVGDQLDALMRWVATGDKGPLEQIAQACMEVKEQNPKRVEAKA